jgi:hypothetical protein
MTTYTTYELRDGMTLVYSVNDAAWRTVTFAAADFADIGAATAKEVAKVLTATGDLRPATDAEGNVVIAPARAIGRGSSLEIDHEKSTAAPALGLSADAPRAEGTGARAARLVSANAEPYAIVAGAELEVTVDGNTKRLALRPITDGAATAAEIATAINAKLPGVATVTRDQHVLISSKKAGPDTHVRVAADPALPEDQNPAFILGFSGERAEDKGEAAHARKGEKTRQARLVASGLRSRLRVWNLGASPVELVMVTRTAVVPAGGSLALSSAEAAHRPLQRLIERGAMRLTWQLER